MSKEDIVERYMADMRACLKNCDRILKEKAVMAIVNGSSVVNKQELDTSKLIVDLSQEIGFSLIDREKLRIVGPHMGLSASLGTRGIDATFKNQKYEDVLILSR